jgi:hypothetical protein
MRRRLTRSSVLVLVPPFENLMFFILIVAAVSVAAALGAMVIYKSLKPTP